MYYGEESFGCSLLLNVISEFLKKIDSAILVLNYKI